jgi:hypothetical protein
MINQIATINQSDLNNQSISQRNNRHCDLIGCLNSLAARSNHKTDNVMRVLLPFNMAWLAMFLSWTTALILHDLVGW